MKAGQVVKRNEKSNEYEIIPSPAVGGLGRGSEIADGSGFSLHGADLRGGLARHDVAPARSVDGGIVPADGDRNTGWLWQSDLGGIVRLPFDARCGTVRFCVEAIGFVVFIASPWSNLLPEAS